MNPQRSTCLNTHSCESSWTEMSPCAAKVGLVSLLNRKKKKKDAFSVLGGFLVPTFVGIIKWAGAKRSNFWRRRQKTRMRGKYTQRDGQTYGWSLTPAVEDAHRWCSYCRVAKRFRRRLFVYSHKEKERPCAHKWIIFSTWGCFIWISSSVKSSGPLHVAAI